MVITTRRLYSTAALARDGVGAGAVGKFSEWGSETLGRRVKVEF